MNRAPRLISCAVALALSGCGAGMSGQSSGQATTPPVTATPAQVMHVISYGQSLSLGERSTDSYPGDVSIPVDDINVGYMFKGGTRPTDLSALVPFAESTNPVDPNVWNIQTPGETPLYGALYQLRDLPGSRIGSAAGRGGTSIVGLSKGTEPYQRLLDQVRAAKSDAPSSSAYNVVAVLWFQGQADVGNADYETEFLQLTSDLETDITSISGQANPVQFYVCVPGDVPDVAAAQRAVAARNPLVHVACDTATLPTSDGVHLSAVGSRAAGYVLGTAIHAELTAE